MTSTSPEDSPRPAPTRRAILRAGIGGAAAAGIATVGLARPAAAATVKPLAGLRTRARLRLAGAGNAAGMSWTGWAQIAPGMVTSNPFAFIASSPFTGQLPGAAMWLFATGQDNRIYANTSADGQNWNGWNEVPGGGQTTSGPTVSLGPSGSMVLSVTGLDRAIWLNSTTDGTNWAGWSSIGGQTFVAPLLAEPILRVYAVGTDDEIFVNTTTDLRNFSGWNVVAGNGRTDASLCLEGFNFSGVGGADVLFAKGTNGHLFYNPVVVTPGISTSIVGKWTEVAGGGVTDAAPAVTGFSDFIDALLFVKGFEDQRIFVNRADGFPNFGNWEEVPGNGLTNTAPCAGSVFNAFGGAQIFLFVVGTDGTPFLNIGT